MQIKDSAFLRVLKESWDDFRAVLPVRDRHLFTRRGVLRARYWALPLLMAGGLTAVAVAGFSKDTQAHYGKISTVRADYALGTSAAQDNLLSAAVMRGLARDSAGRMAAAHDAVSPVALQAQDNGPQPRFKTVEIAKGGTLDAALQKAGLSASESYRMVEAMKDLYDPRKVRPGQEISVRYDPVDQPGEGSGGAGYDFAALRLTIDPLQTLVVKSDEAGALSAAIEDRPTETRAYVKKADIEVSLYGSAAKAGIPAAVIADAIRVYSWDVDFQRDIRQGDQIEVLYEQLETPEGERIKSGNILYARLVVNGREVPIYRYENDEGDVDYYTPDGRSIRKALMKTPVDGARISSGFGMRKHPVLGYSKMHKGLDFAAPTGTPIYAAGDGVVEKAGPFSSFGNYVRIRHNSNLKTAYAHMQYIKKGVRVGTRVKQGQVIGAVGTTGRSTGPHLHYEIHVAGKQVNPQTHKSEQGEALKGAQLAAFKSYTGQIDQQYAALSGDLKYAEKAGEKKAGLN